MNPDYKSGLARDTHYAIRLNGSVNERRGLAKSLAVMTGDTVKAEVYAKYLDPDQNNWTAALQNLMAAIAGGTAPTGTRAYLNILLFDENLGFLDAAYVPVSMAAREDGTNVPHEKLSGEIVVQQPGYAYIYFSNDNGQPLEVFFDDFTVEHVHSAIVQADDYYPFGLTFNSYRRELGKLNEYLYCFCFLWFVRNNRPMATNRLAKAIVPLHPKYRWINPAAIDWANDHLEAVC